MSDTPKIAPLSHKKLLASAAIACALFMYTASTAQAGSTYFLQLGSFYSRADAQQKWEDLKTKNPEIFSRLNLHIAEVSIPPDNNISYRTQAGPIDSHSKAEGLCNTIQEKAGECYVVETAIMTSDTVSTAPAAAEVKTRTPERAESKPLPPQTAPNMFVSGREPKFLDDDAPAPIVPASPAPAAPLASNTLSSPPVAAPIEVKTEAKPVASIKPKTAPRMRRAAKNDINISPAEARKSTLRFGAPKPEVEFDAEPEVKEEITPVPITPAAPVEAENSSPKEQQRPGFFARLFGASSEEPPREKTTSNETSANAASGDGQGDIKVAEAIRVPLSPDNNSGNAARTNASNAGGTTLFESPPHASASEKAVYWAQINYFQDEAHAQSFYEEFREQYPDISEGLRFRVTRPYNSKVKRVSLRVGAFLSTNDVQLMCNIANQKTLSCTTVKDVGAAQSYDTTTLAPHAGISPASTAPSPFASAASEAAISDYWVQLGSYASPDEAWDKWSTLRKTHKKVLSKATADVNSPENNSSDNSIYRLRMGPYSNRQMADALCAKLSKSGESCLVVNER